MSCCGLYGDEHYVKPREVSKLLIRMPNWIGDCVMATAILPEIRRQYPQASITALCKFPLDDLLKFNPYVDKVISFQKKPSVAELRKEHFDLGILTTNSFSSAWDFFCMRIKRRLGFSTDCRRVLLTHPVKKDPLSKKQHLVKTYHRLIGNDGLIQGPCLFLHQDEDKLLNDFLKLFGCNLSATFIGVNPGAAYGSAKCWMPERFHETISRVHALYPDVKFLIFGDRSSQELASKIVHGHESYAHDLCGKTDLRLLMLLLRRCKVVLTNDSGPMHIADALKTPVVALFGSTNPLATGPYYHSNTIYKHVSCSPCYLRSCPIDFKCMKSITVSEVVNHMRHFLDLC